ncbi:hypothetical protein OC834_006611 [Tilletia horrida]|uniref:DUF1014-domain-containing protein n=1 Tax=Tilletia horrida TaxID=155126 RepID=A0AAN6GAY2_9BASI|nr:hypothetical protein OC834_006611 [Tilletia horrida]KAK0526666.1 hypothetical protein OC842_005122 [Tilletia horrida]KAK0535884.1 hypothetical protein OC835_002227 [Tilletia horrida]KAK0564446.1 hypothetical protein OC844_001706 [Tilletia horrida]
MVCAKCAKTLSSKSVAAPDPFRNRDAAGMLVSSGAGASSSSSKAGMLGKSAGSTAGAASLQRTASGPSRKIGENKLLSSKNRFNPLGSQCTICKARVQQDRAKYCQRNSKAVAGRARKEEAANNKKAAEAAKAEAAEAAKWDEGAKGKGAKDAKAEKAAEQARKRAELERLKREDEEALPKGPSEGKQKVSAQAAKRDAKATAKASGKSAAAASSSSSSAGAGAGGIDAALESFSADNIDDALDALTLVTEKTDSASRGSKAADIERHPERRFKAAFEAFKERRVPELRKENPGLRLQQVQELAYKEFQKSEENPFNQAHLSYDADKGSRLAALDSIRAGKEARLRDA